MPQAHQGKLQQAIAQRGPALVVALLGALCETCPRNLMRPAAMLLHRLLAMPGLQETARSWLATALQSAELQGASWYPPGYSGCGVCCCTSNVSPVYHS